MRQGLTDFAVLVINRQGQDQSADDVKDYSLPILQDTQKDDVFGLWEASDYDLFVVSRTGDIDYVQSDSRPLDDSHDIVELLVQYIP